MPEFPSIAHIAVTVTDLDRSTQWYTALFGSGPVLDEDEGSGTFHHTVSALSGGQLFGLHTHTQPATETFDERHTGLDHVAFACGGRNELQRWADRLKELGILPRRDQGRHLRFRRVVPRPRRHRPRVLRTARGRLSRTPRCSRKRLASRQVVPMSSAARQFRQAVVKCSATPRTRRPNLPVGAGRPPCRESHVP